MKTIAYILLLVASISPTYSEDKHNPASLKLTQLKITASTTKLLQHAASGDLKTVKLLIASGIDINQTEPINGASALHNAAALGHIKMVKWLLANHANIETKDKQGHTPLDWANYHQRDKVIKYLNKQQNKAGKKQITVIAPRTILDYPQTQATTQTTAQTTKAPQSSFHDWKEAQAQAQMIIKQWQNNPVTIPWTKLQLKKYIKHKMMPSRGARALALTHVAMHDALVKAQNNSAQSQLTVSMAAASVMGYLFPAEERAFKRIVYSIAAQIHATTHDNLPKSAQNAIAQGQKIAKRIIQYAQNDGAQYGWNGTRLQWYGQGRWYGPGSWEPTPPYFYYPPEEPYAPTWKTWILDSGSQFRANPPPEYGSKEFITALKEVLNVDKNLTAEQLKSAKFWVDGHGTVTPAGHWNQIAIEHIHQTANDLETAALFAQLNIAMADSYIAAWDTKYHYWSIRPVTAAKKLLDIKFKPAILTPPFPSYVSGHAATSGAGSQILANFFPNHANDLIALGDQAAMSRLYGGIHYRFDNDEGLVLGRKVANKVISFFDHALENKQTKVHNKK